MKQVFKFTDRADFYFIIEYLGHFEIDINSCDDIDALYNQIKDAMQAFEVSPQYTQSTSYLQAIKDYLNSVKYKD